MYISKIHIENFKGYKKFNLEFNKKMNIIVGDNEAGKSTLLEAVNLVLGGYINGKYLTKESLDQYLFNKEVVDDYLERVSKGEQLNPPHILIEIFLKDETTHEELSGTSNYTKVKAEGLYLKICLKQEHQDGYDELLKNNRDLFKDSLPLEYYDIELYQFSGNPQMRLSLDLKSYLIDNSSNFQDASDLMIARIIKSKLEENEKLEAAQLHRQLKDVYTKNGKIYKAFQSHILDPDISVSVDPSAKNSWDSHLSVFYRKIPFSYIGKGQQTVLKTDFSLSSKKSQEAGVILIEELENHLSHSVLNQLIKRIEDSTDKQIIISTHHSFVANKLNLENLILINEREGLKFKDLDQETKNFFKKLPGYDTLRIILCKKAILVEGDSDELVVQKAYKDKFGSLPIEGKDGVDVVSIGTSFKRFIEITKKINKPTAVIIDADKKIESRKKDKKELDTSYIKLFFEENDLYKGKLEDYNNNTLEPLLLKYNSLAILNKVFKTYHEDDDKLLSYMKENKTEYALKIFESEEKLNYPKYILDAISFVSKENEQK